MIKNAVFHHCWEHATVKARCAETTQASYQLMPYAELKTGECNTLRKHHYINNITGISFKNMVLCKKAVQSGAGKVLG